jgi:L-amino acid N-acyltransferase YncA
VNRTQIGTAHGRAATIRPIQDADLAALGDFFAELSMRSRYQRFFAPVKPNGAMLRRMSGSVGGADVLVALHAGVIIGHAMAADAAGPGGERKTDIGVVVADRWQGHGVGSALARELVRRAQARGVRSVTMDVLHANHQVLAMITAHWATARLDDGADCMTAHVRLPQPGQRPRIRQPARPERAAPNRQERPAPPRALARHRTAHRAVQPGR